jgi:molecular chaperone Hsp33
MPRRASSPGCSGRPRDGFTAMSLAGDAGAVFGDPVDDTLVPFQVDPLDVRGRIVRLGPELDRMLARHAYPESVTRVLGEAATLAVLLGSALKLSGRFQLQTKSDGAIPMLVVDFEAPGKLRAYAQFDAGRLDAGASTGALLGHGHMALTIDQGGDMRRYQGLVPLEGTGFEEAAHQYFRQSEQIPTRVRLAVGQSQQPGGAAAWRAGGLFLQFLPQAPERMRQADLPPGDVPAGAVIDMPAEDDAWLEARALADTVEAHELLDPSLSSERLLYRLFHERGVRVYRAEAVREACRCSEERILAMLRRFSPDDRKAMIGEDGKIGVTCEFCSTRYTVEPAAAEPQDQLP